MHGKYQQWIPPFNCHISYQQKDATVLVLSAYLHPDPKDKNTKGTKLIPLLTKKILNKEAHQVNINIYGF